MILGLGFILIGGFALYFSIVGADPVDALRRALIGIEAPAQLPTSGSRTIGSTPRGGGEIPLPSSSHGGGTPSTNRALGRAMAAARGWTGAEWTALDQRWTMESGWSEKAVNPSSEASGIPQRLPRAHPFGPAERVAWPTPERRRGIAAVQIRWGLAYIAGRYGKPSNIPTSGPY